jgi:hypothetical protein
MADVPQSRMLIKEEENMNDQTCMICGRKAVQKGYCNLHAKAFDNILSKYECWRKALDLAWKEYLREIAENSLTGEWARQVAEHLARTEDKR